MKTRIILTTIALASILLNACDEIDHVRPSDNITTQEYSFSDYGRIETESAFTVYVNFSDTEERIEIEANDNLHDHIEVKKESGTLFIGFRNNVGINGPATLNAYITTKQVTGYSASGASRFFVEQDINDESASIFLSGASMFTGDLNVDHLTVEMSGASIADITGSANEADLRGSGASNFGGYDFSTDYLNIHFSGASNAALTVTDEMDVTASGASVIRYKGSAVIHSQNISGGSQLIHMN